MIRPRKLPWLVIWFGIFISGATHAETIKMVFGTEGDSEYGGYQAGNIYIGPNDAAPPEGTCGARVEDPDAWYFAEIAAGGFLGPLDLLGNGDPADYIQVTGPFGPGCDGSYHFQTPAFQGFHGPEDAGAIIIQGDDITWLDHADNPVVPEDLDEVDWCPPNTCKLLLDLLSCYWEIDHNGNLVNTCDDEDESKALVGFATQIKVLSQTMANNAVLLQRASGDRETTLPTAYQTWTEQIVRTILEARAAADEVYADLRRGVPRSSRGDSVIQSLDVQMDLLRMTAEQCADHANPLLERESIRNHRDVGTAELKDLKSSCESVADNAQSVIDTLVLLTDPRSQ